MRRDADRAKAAARLAAEGVREYAEKGSSIGRELMLAYTVAQACDILLTDADGRLRSAFRAFGLEPKPNGELRGLANYCAAVRSAAYWWDRHAGRMVEESTFGAFGGEAGARSLDNFRADANTLVRLLMAFCDRTYGDDAQEAEVFRLLASQSPHGLFTEEDAARFSFARPVEGAQG